MIECERFSNDFLSGLSLWARENNKPLTLTMELTPYCNFRCVMCYVRLSPDQAKNQGELLNCDQWLRIAEQAKAMGTLNLTLTGGEPFTHPEFWQIYEQLNKMGFLICVLSNGYLINEDVIENFKKYGKPFLLKITLYGASDETYKRVCGVPDGFTKVSRAIGLIKEAEILLKLTSTIVRENAEDLQKIYSFAKENGVTVQHGVSVLKSTRGAVNTAEKSRFDFTEFSDELTLETLEMNKYPPSERPFDLCASYRRSLFVTWHGHLQLCSFLSQPYVRYSGRLKEDYDELSERLENIKNPEECAECKWKEFCQRCPAILCSESGDPERIDNSFCDMAKRLCDLYNLKRGN